LKKHRRQDWPKLEILLEELALQRSR
jgi:hypothetical protein